MKGKKRKGKRQLKLTCFLIYYCNRYPLFLSTYKMNPFGLNQEQYIFIINFVLFFVFGSITHMVVFQQYNIKSIGKDGIELEKPVEVAVLENNNNIICNIGAQLGALDEIVHELYKIGYVTKKLEFSEYTNLLEKVLYPIAKGYEEVVINVLKEEDYLRYLKEDKGYSAGLIKKAFYSFSECGIIPVEDAIHIKYKLGGIQGYDIKEVYIIIQLGTLFDIKLGELIYGYIKCFESLYSAYIHD